MSERNLTSAHGTLPPCQISEKTNESISINHADKRTKEQKDGRTDEWTDPIL